MKLGSSRFRIPADKIGRVKVKFPSPRRRLVLENRRARSIVAITHIRQAGKSRQAAQSMRLIPPKGR